jgi:putative ABC transport system permease protein
MYHVDSPTGNISLKEIKPFLNPKHPLIGTAVPLSLGDSYKGYRIVGTTQAFLDLYKPEIREGRIWEQNFEVTVGDLVARTLELKIGDEFKSSHGFEEGIDAGHVDHLSFKVVGIFESQGTVVDQLILTTNQSYWLVHDEAAHDDGHSESQDTTEDHHAHDHESHDGHSHEDHAHEDHSHAEETVSDNPANLLEESETLDITSLLITFKARNFQALNMQRNINENTDLQAATPAIEINRLYSLMGTGERILRLLAWAITIVSGLSVFISLFSSLRDRRYELALMRVMGAGRMKLFVLIILEGLILAGIGCIAGIILSHGSMEILGGSMQESYRYHFTGWRLLQEELWLVVGALGIGFIAAVLPAWQASRTDIATTLTEG